MSEKTCSVCDEPDAPTCIYGHPHKPGRASLQCPMTIAHTRCILDDDHTGYCRTDGGYHLTPRELDPAERYGLMRLPVPARLVKE